MKFQNIKICSDNFMYNGSNISICNYIEMMPKEMETMVNSVYTHAEQIRINSSHGKDINYLVCYGFVDWKKDTNLRPAVYVLMEYRGKISYETPAHITTDKNPDGSTDFENVMLQINILKNKYSL